MITYVTYLVVFLIAALLISLMMMPTTSTLSRDLVDGLDCLSYGLFCGTLAGSLLQLVDILYSTP